MVFPSTCTAFFFKGLEGAVISVYDKHTLHKLHEMHFVDSHIPTVCTFLFFFPLWYHGL